MKIRTQFLENQIYVRMTAQSRIDVSYAYILNSELFCITPSILTGN